MLNSLSTVPYVDDILHQPQALQDTLSALAGAELESVAKCIQTFRSKGSLQQVILTGMGSSYHVLQPLLLGLLRQGIPARMMETSELVHYTPGLLSANALTVAVSQSGASAEILQLLKQMPPQAVLIGVTNTPGSPLATRANALLLTRAGLGEYGLLQDLCYRPGRSGRAGKAPDRPGFGSGSF